MALAFLGVVAIAFSMPAPAVHSHMTRIRPALSATQQIAPTMSIAVPTCTSAGVATVAVAAGGITLLSQISLWAFFQRSKDPVLNAAPGYTAHQIIALALMVLVTALGFASWLSPPAAAATAVGRLLAPTDSARWLGALLLGALVAWDIPTCLKIGRLRKPDMLIHHFGMAAVALIGCVWLPTRYGLYYMGVVELSSVPLAIFSWSDVAVELAGSATDDDDPMKPSAAKREALRQLRDTSKAVAAVTFIGMRAVDFTRVTLTRFVPDAVSVLSMASTTLRWPIYFMIVSSVSFVGLQLYWLSLFVRISLTERKRAKRREAKQQKKNGG